MSKENRVYLEAKYVSQKWNNMFTGETLEDKIARFEDKFIPEPNSGCWLWLGAVSDAVNPSIGCYARVKIGGRGHYASRVSHEFYKGPVPDDLKVLHSCDNPYCVNPDHLRIGTHADNMREMHARKRHNAIHAVGSANKSAKLTEAIVRSIKFGDLCAERSSTLATKFGVSRGTIDFIRSGKTWGHVDA